MEMIEMIREIKDDNPDIFGVNNFLENRETENSIVRPLFKKLEGETFMELLTYMTNKPVVLGRM
jgi:hypothetical protein